MRLLYELLTYMRLNKESLKGPLLGKRGSITTMGTNKVEIRSLSLMVDVTKLRKSIFTLVGSLMGPR